MKLNYIFSSKTGLKRTLNEDFVDVFEVDDGLLAVVCDGLGGNNAGDVASKTAVDAIYRFFSANLDLPVQERIVRAVHYANESIIQSAAINHNYSGMATTVVLLFINKQRAYWGHVGDSRVYYHNSEQLQQVTKDHSLVQKLVDDGYITEKEAARHPHKNVIMRALGDKKVIEVDCEEFLFDRNRDWKFLLCTDGVSNFVQHPELEEILKDPDLEIISKAFSMLIEERGAPDNYSFVIISNQVK